MNKEYKIIIALLLAVPFSLAAKIYFENNLYLCWNKECIELFGNYFSPAIESLKISLAIVAMLCVFHQIRQIERNTANTKTTNTFRDYISHREAFFDLLKSHENDVFEIKNKEELYKLFFPFNSPRKFRPEPASNDEAPETIYSLIQRFNETVKQLNTIGKNTGGFSSHSHRDLCHQITELNSIRSQLTINQATDIPIENNFQGLCGIFKQAPKKPSETSYRIGLLLESLRNFCCLEVNKHTIERLNYDLNSESPAYSVIVQGTTYSSSDEPGTYEEGQQASKNGLGKDSCPYLITSVEGQVWREGWDSIATQENNKEE